MIHMHNAYCHGTQGKGKHTARYCPLYTGTYEKTWLTQTNAISVWKKNESAVVDLVSQSPPQSQTMVVQQQQPRQHPLSSQASREIKQLKDTITQLQEVIRNQVSKQQQYETIIHELRQDRKEMKDMLKELMSLITTRTNTTTTNGVQVIPHDAPPTPVMTSTRGHITASPAAVGNRSRGNSLVNLANQSLITSTIKPVNQSIPHSSIPTHNAFTALMQPKPPAKQTTTTPHPTTSTEDEIQDDNDVDDMDDVDMSSTPKEASSFPLGKKHTRTVESSPNKKPKKKTKPLRSKQL